MSSAEELNLAIDLPGHAEWASIEVVRNSIQESLADFLLEEGCQTIAMIARELLENATKYGGGGRMDKNVRLRIWSSLTGGPPPSVPARAALADSEGPFVSVLVENQVKPGDAGVGQLLTILAWMKQFKTPAEAFQARLLEDREAGESGLGLVRIAHEGNCALSAEVVDSTLRVIAHVPVEDGWRRLTAPADLRQPERAMESLSTGDLRIEYTQSENGSPIVLTWRGSSIDANPAQTVTPYCRSVFDHAGQNKVGVEMHFEHLTYFNSATISVLIGLIQEARTRQLGLLLTYDGSVKWQRLNFEALSVFTKGAEMLKVKSI
jgi:hypothetical protein